MLSEDEKSNIETRKENSMFQRKHKTLINDKDDYWFSASNFKNDVTKQTGLYKKSLKLINRLYKGEFKLENSYINSLVFGDITRIHTDNDDNNVTVLYYINDKWDPEWGGETIYYKDNEPEVSILPKKGRIVLADSRIPHAGRSPTRMCYKTRYVFILKFERIK